MNKDHSDEYLTSFEVEVLLNKLHLSLDEIHITHTSVLKALVKEWKDKSCLPSIELPPIRVMKPQDSAFIGKVDITKNYEGLSFA